MSVSAEGELLFVVLSVEASRRKLNVERWVDVDGQSRYQWH